MQTFTFHLDDFGVHQISDLNNVRRSLFFPLFSCPESGGKRGGAFPSSFLVDFWLDFVHLAHCRLLLTLPKPGESDHDSLKFD